MWFRQLSFYRLNQDDAPDNEQLSAALEKRPFQHCMGLDWFSEGWVPASGHLDAPVYAVRGCQMVSLRREDKVLPSSVIRDFVELKVAEIEDKELRKVGRKEKLALKEQITDDLLPRAFVRSSRMSAYLDTRRGWLMVDSAAASKAEALVSKLREALPPFPAALPRTKIAPHTAMTDWLAAGEAPAGFELDSDCELKDSGENGAVVRCARIDLTADEIRQHIATGKQVTRVGLIWQEKIRFQLTDMLQLKRLQFLDLLQDEASQAGDDRESLFEATFTLMSEELGELVDALVAALGGLEDAPSPAAAAPATDSRPAVVDENAAEVPWD
ncbi:recombination associated protein RdgC [Chromobacterium alkanivorans]|uniref:recombination-associated protein RdgC n=1 Tax=Chromobacterium alkanivorans TaxID=1071719 RepID=UPI00196718D3|nr:recombination-associated protein RdgC [Chromobacterium alkanivorans]MBN3005553.1 recombination-associated protein RdgC [Chromobacterium alkanivorans]MCS3806354.1 recombination associated protein RdgC [Chromobacterium alkanivorans]MCS3820634.1 recombination associated protein RdgC [Chromobacterium alkanivorans]MCS3875392.1 recombination associated protein RdgC [Chromobacterium alkanivorans]